MPRAMDAGFLAAIQADVIRPVTLVEIDFPTGFVFGHTRTGIIEFDGQDYEGLGDFLEISPIRGAEGLEAIGVNVRLSGIPPSVMPIVLAEHYRGRRMRIWQGMLAEDGSLAGTSGPWRYWLDAPEIVFGSECTVTLAAEGVAARLGRPIGIYWTDAEHRGRYPDDRFWEFAPQAADKEVIWPAVPGASGSRVNRATSGSSPGTVGNEQTLQAIGDDFDGDITYTVETGDNGRGN